MLIIIFIIAIIFIAYESLKVAGTANLAPATPLGVSSLGDDYGNLPTITQLENGNLGEFSPVDINGQNMITNDSSSWPSGDRIWDICRAIAIAEGANVENSNPDRLNNPGDISDGADTYGFENHSGSKVTKFPDKETGWKWLYRKINNALNGNSDVFKPTMTWLQFAQKYAGNWQSWVNNVTSELGVSPNDIIGNYGA